MSDKIPVDPGGPVRKYFSEFCINMFGSVQVLLQQNQLELLEHDELGSKYPCHIYMILRRPRVMLDPDSIVFTDDLVRGTFRLQKGCKIESYKFEIPNFLRTHKVRLECEFPFSEYKVFDESDELISAGSCALLITTFGKFWELLSLEVLYIGQSYGVEGVRTAPKRLMSHSTLQAIYAEAVRRTPDQEIWLLLWSFEPLMLASFDGTQASYGTTDEEDERHVADVLQGITEQQQINFTEAALIRYFEPEYNRTFKDSFPNPAHTTYAECYSLDINAVSVELQTENLMVQLWSPKVPADWVHLAKFPLHSREERQGIFEIY